MKFISEEKEKIMRRGSKIEKNVFIYCIINNYSNRKICKLMKLSYFRVLQFKKELALTLFEKGISHDVICKNLNIKTPSLYMYKDPYLKNNGKKNNKNNKKTIQVYPKENNTTSIPSNSQKSLKIDETLFENFQKLKINQDDTSMIDTLIKGIEKI